MPDFVMTIPHPTDPEDGINVLVEYGVQQGLDATWSSPAEADTFEIHRVINEKTGVEYPDVFQDADLMDRLELGARDHYYGRR
jgi:hypothetical protein